MMMTQHHAPHAPSIAAPSSFTPAASFSRTLVNLARGRVHFGGSNRGRRILMEDGTRFTIFRQVRVEGPQVTEAPTSPVVFRVRFRLANMRPWLNKLFSLLPIPLFIGLPGFQAKCWCLDEATGTFQGLYEWRSRAHAEAYARSFAMRFMVGRSVPGTVHHDILPGRSLDEYVGSLSEADEVLA